MDNLSPEDNPLRILLVEDNPTDVLLLAEALEEVRTSTFTFSHAKRLDEAMQCLHDKHFDVVLLDLGLPDSQGLDTFHRMHRVHPLTPILIMSGLDDDDVAFQAVKDGAQDYLVKGVINRTMLVRTIRDITVRKQSEAALKELSQTTERRERMLSTALSSISDFAQIYDRQGRLLFVNQPLLDLWGMTLEEVVGKNFFELSYPAELAGRLQQQVQEVFETKQRLTDETSYTSPTGQQGYYEYIFSPVFAADGTVDFVVGSTRNMTERKKIAQVLEVTMRQLERSNSDLQHFASIASHDMQEPLRAIQTFGDRLQAKHGASLNEEGRDYLARMQKAAGRMRTLIQDLLAYSRVTTKTHAFAAVDLGATATAILSDLAIRLEETRGRVEVGELPSIEADAMQMRQLLQNLMANALKFHREDEPPLVRIYAQQPAQEAHLKPMVHIVVEDNGIGFDEKFVERIFAPFERLHTQSKYSGTGIGLAICRKIAERHGGTISATSVPGQGSKFIVELPLRQPEPEAELESAERL